MMWKVRLERWLTDGKSPDITLKSGFDYDLPELCCEMLDDACVSDVEMRDSVFAYISEHCLTEFAGSGFYPVGIEADNETS